MKIDWLIVLIDCFNKYTCSIENIHIHVSAGMFSSMFSFDSFLKTIDVQELEQIILRSMLINDNYAYLCHTPFVFFIAQCSICGKTLIVPTLDSWGQAHAT